MTFGWSVATIAGMGTCAMSPTVATSLGAIVGSVVVATTSTSASTTTTILVVVVVVVAIVVGVVVVVASVVGVVVVVTHHGQHHILHLSQHGGFSGLEIGFSTLETVGHLIGWSRRRW